MTPGRWGPINRVTIANADGRWSVTLQPSHRFGRIAVRILGWYCQLPNVDQVRNSGASEHKALRFGDCSLIPDGESDDQVGEVRVGQRGDDARVRALQPHHHAPAFHRTRKSASADPCVQAWAN